VQCSKCLTQLQAAPSHLGCISAATNIDAVCGLSDQAAGCAHDTGRLPRCLLLTLQLDTPATGEACVQAIYARHAHDDSQQSEATAQLLTGTTANCCPDSLCHSHCLTNEKGCLPGAQATAAATSRCAFHIAAVLSPWGSLQCRQVVVWSRDQRTLKVAQY
jgi:hypothetical protein